MLAILFCAMLRSQIPADTSNAALCDSPRKPDLLACAENQRREAQANLDRYLSVATKVLAEESPSVMAAFNRAQKAWLAYADAECRVLYESSGQGEREIQFAFCRVGQIRARTHEIWSLYLADVDAGLPEPPGPCDP